jgi:hypothetical protein
VVETVDFLVSYVSAILDSGAYPAQHTLGACTIGLVVMDATPTTPAARGAR